MFTELKGDSVIGAIPHQLKRLIEAHVGPGPLLQGFGIRVVHESPAVGGNLQDHLGIDYL